MEKDDIEWLLIILFLIAMIGIVVSLVIWSIYNGISPMPTSMKAKSRFITFLPIHVEGHIYELGSGWGTLFFVLARHYPNAKLVGYETSPVPYLFSCLRLKLSSYPNAKLIRTDLFNVDFSQASLIVCYLYPGAMKKLKIKFENELKPETLIISNTFAIPNWTPTEIIEIPDLYHNKIYLYKKAKQQND